MTRTKQLQSIGLLRIEDVHRETKMNQNEIRYRIRLLGLISFEKWWYDEHQLEMIINFEIYKKEL